MSKVKFELNYKGVGELLRSPEMAAAMQSVAEEKAAGLSGCATDTWTGNRAIASIYTETSDAYQENLENNTLLKAVGK